MGKDENYSTFISYHVWRRNQIYKKNLGRSNHLMHSAERMPTSTDYLTLIWTKGGKNSEGNSKAKENFFFHSNLPKSFFIVTIFKCNM